MSRLYFVDCPETSVNSRSDAQRVREQARYFGLTSAERIIHFGNEAKTFVEHVLDKAFTVYTAFASALGKSAKGRVYAFIIGLRNFVPNNIVKRENYRK